MRSAGREPSEEVTVWLDHLVLARHRTQGRASGGQFDMTAWLQRLLTTEDRPRPPELQPLATISDRPSIVILPYVDLSPGARRAPLAEGMTEEATNALARMPGFFVAARQ